MKAKEQPCKGEQVSFLSLKCASASKRREEIDMMIHLSPLIEEMRDM